MIREESIGLTDREAARLLAQNGYNTLEQKSKSSVLGIFAGQFKDMMVMILLAATAASAMMGETHEALAIAAIVLINALLGFFQEWRCEKTLEALAAMSAPTAKVRRSGKLKEIPASQVVEGDILKLSAGDSVAADCVILSQSSLRCDESLLTGESAAVSKQEAKEGTASKESMLFMGTHIVAGRAVARVCATGMNTEMGAVAGMLSNIEEQQTPLQQRLDHVGRVIGISCIAICTAVAVIGILRGNAPFDMLITGISLAVAAVPEGLPAIVTVSLALAVRRILLRNALIKRLHAVETLGCATVICSDKTGTLTQNKMRVQQVAVFGGEYDIEQAAEKAARSPLFSRLMSCAAFCNDAKAAAPKKSFLRSERVEFEGEPTEKALLEAAYSAGIRQQDFFRTGETPFSSETKMMTVWGGCSDGRERVFIKGAPEKLLPLCKSVMTENGVIPLDDSAKRKIIEQNSRMAAKALRVIGFAYSEKGKETIFLGLMGLFDPPRPEAAEAVAQCRRAKIRVIMITGDHAETALAVARQLSIVDGKAAAVTGRMIDDMSEQQLREVCRETNVFARVTPAHKLAIVKALKQNGEIAAMTGDGVNDAPAVKEANIGVAMGKNGTDVTREAADVILLDDNFATLVAAVEEGRVIYQNIRRFLRYLLACNVGEVLTMLGGMLMGMPVILTPIQLLLVNLVTDGLPAVALGLEPPDKDVMHRPPRAPDESIFAGGMPGQIALRGCLIGIATLGAFSLFYSGDDSLPLARTAALAVLTLSQLFFVFECRSEQKSIFRIDPFGNPFLLMAVIFSFFCLMAAIFLPFGRGAFATAALSSAELVRVIAISGAVTVLSSLLKLFGRENRR